MFVLFLDNANDYSRTFSVARSDHCPPLTKRYMSALWAEFVFVIIFHFHTPLFFFASQATFFLPMIMLVVLILWTHWSPPKLNKGTHVCTVGRICLCYHLSLTPLFFFGRHHSGRSWQEMSNTAKVNIAKSIKMIIDISQMTSTKILLSRIFTLYLGRPLTKHDIRNAKRMKSSTIMILNS